MAFLYHELERVPVWFRLGAVVGQEAAPRFELAVVKGVCLRAYLKNNCVYARELEAVEQVAQVGLVLCGGLFFFLSGRV